MYRKYVIYQLSKRPFITCLAIIQFALSIFLLGNIVDRMSNYFVTIRLFKSVSSESSYYISKINDYEYEEIKSIQEESSKSWDDIEKQYENGELDLEECFALLGAIELQTQKKMESYYRSLTPIGGLSAVDSDISLFYSNIYSTAGFNKKHSLTNRVIFLTEDCINGLDYKMTSGQWFDKTDKSDEYIDLVTTDNTIFAVGDIIDLGYYVWAETEDGVYEGRMIDGLKGKIIGTIDADQLLFMGISSEDFDNGENIDLNDFLTENVDLSFIAIYDDDSKLLDPDLLEGAYFIYSHIVTLKKDLSKAEKNAFFAQIAEQGYMASSMSNAYNNTYQNEMKDFQHDMIFMISAILISLIGLVGVGALFAASDMKTFSIYYLNGLSWKQCLMINTMSMGVMMASAIFLSIIIKLVSAYKVYSEMLAIYAQRYHGPNIDYLSRIKFSDYFYYTKTEVLFIIATLIISFAIAMIIPYTTFKKKSPVQVLKTEN